MMKKRLFNLTHIVRNIVKVRNFSIGEQSTIFFNSKLKCINHSKSYYSTNEFVLNTEHSRLKILNENGDSLKFNFLWLRDHCRCQNCYNHLTFQRNIDVTELPLDITPHTCSIEDEYLKIVWQDGHLSSYPLSWLQKHYYDSFLKNRKQRNVVLWDADKKVEDVPSVEYSHFMNHDAGVLELMTSLTQFGIGFVNNVPVNVNTTEKVINKISHVQHTLFGGMWEFSDSFDHSDTAYTKEALGAHTDNTYFTEAAGLQVFHCLFHNGKGGETLLVDGFHAAEKLKREHPDSFERLIKNIVEAEYLEKGYHHSCVEPIIKTDPITKDIVQIRYNLYDRAPLSSLPYTEVLQHYQDLFKLAKIIKNPQSEWWVKLLPGTVAFIDNFRVLHGRSAYDGIRKMCGCYIGRGDFLSKARVLGLI